MTILRAKKGGTSVICSTPRSGEFKARGVNVSHVSLSDTYP